MARSLVLLLPVILLLLSEGQVHAIPQLRSVASKSIGQAHLSLLVRNWFFGQEDDAFEVRDAGDARVNGKYVKYGTYGGNPTYRPVDASGKVDLESGEIYKLADLWIITHKGVEGHMYIGEGETPADAAWAVGSAGKPPTPTLQPASGAASPAKAPQPASGATSPAKAPHQGGRNKGKRNEDDDDDMPLLWMWLLAILLIVLCLICIFAVRKKEEKEKDQGKPSRYKSKREAEKQEAAEESLLPSQKHSKEAPLHHRRSLRKSIAAAFDPDTFARSRSSTTASALGHATTDAPGGVVDIDTEFIIAGEHDLDNSQEQKLTDALLKQGYELEDMHGAPAFISATDAAGNVLGDDLDMSDLAYPLTLKLQVHVKEHHSLPSPPSPRSPKSQRSSVFSITGATEPLPPPSAEDAPSSELAAKLSRQRTKEEGMDSIGNIGSKADKDSSVGNELGARLAKMKARTGEDGEEVT